MTDFHNARSPMKIASHQTDVYGSLIELGPSSAGVVYPRSPGHGPQQVFMIRFDFNKTHGLKSDDAQTTSNVSVAEPRHCHLYVTAMDAAANSVSSDGEEFPSIAAAQSAVQAKLRGAADDEDFVVCLGPGTHSVVGAPLEFDAADSPRGSARVIWRGSQGPNASIVSGGLQVKDWTATTLAGGPAFSATVPAVASGLATVRQLWVQGTRAKRTAMDTANDCRINLNCTIVNASVQNCAPGTSAPHNCPGSGDACIGYKWTKHWGHCAHCECSSNSSLPAASFFEHECLHFEQNNHWGHCAHCECKSNNSLPIFTPWVVKAGGPGAAPTEVGFITSEPLPDSWTANGRNTKAIEFTWPIIIDNWIEPRCTVAYIKGNNVTLSSPCGLHL